MIRSSLNRLLIAGALMLGPTIPGLTGAAEPVDKKEEAAKQNLRLLAHGLDRYMRYNEGKLPAHLSELYAESFVLDLDVFMSPASGNRITSAKEIDEKTDYLLAPAAPGDQPQALLKEKQGFHGGKALAYYSDRSIKKEEPGAIVVTPGSGGSGSTKNTAKIPVIAGLTAAEAKKALTTAGLKAKFELGGEAPTVEKARTVATVDPAEGTIVAKGTEVTVRIYGDATEVKDGIKLPNVAGLSVQKAKEALVKEGFKPKIELGKAAANADEQYKVYAMVPEAGRVVSKGSEVTVTIFGPPEKK